MYLRVKLSLIAYYEVTIKPHKEHEIEYLDDSRQGPQQLDSCIAIGLARKAFPLIGKQPGWDRFSYGYHGDDGNKYHQSGIGTAFGPSFSCGDTIGCGIDYINQSIFYTKNGDFIGTAFTHVSGALYPVVGVDSSDIISVNFGLSPFLFDVDSYEKHVVEKKTRRKTNATGKEEARERERESERITEEELYFLGRGVFQHQEERERERENEANSRISRLREAFLLARDRARVLYDNRIRHGDFDLGALEALFSSSPSAPDSDSQRDRERERRRESEPEDVSQEVEMKGRETGNDETRETEREREREPTTRRRSSSAFGLLRAFEEYLRSETSSWITGESHVLEIDPADEERPRWGIDDSDSDDDVMFDSDEEGDEEDEVEEEEEERESESEDDEREIESEEEEEEEEEDDEEGYTSYEEEEEEEEEELDDADIILREILLHNSDSEDEDLIFGYTSRQLFLQRLTRGVLKTGKEKLKRALRKPSVTIGTQTLNSYLLSNSPSLTLLSSIGPPAFYLPPPLSFGSSGSVSSSTRSGRHRGRNGGDEEMEGKRENEREEEMKTTSISSHSVSTSTASPIFSSLPAPSSSSSLSSLRSSPSHSSSLSSSSSTRRGGVVKRKSRKAK